MAASVYDNFLKKYDMDLEEEERWILQCASLKKSTVNLTDMTWDELTSLDRRCRKILKNRRRITRLVRHEIIKFQSIFRNSDWLKRLNGKSRRIFHA